MAGLPINIDPSVVATSPGTAVTATAIQTIYQPVTRSGTVTAGGTAQALMAANATRRGWSLQNLSSGDLWINELGGTAAAAQPAVQIAPGASVVNVTNGVSLLAISLFGATTGQAFAAREW